MKRYASVSAKDFQLRLRLFPRAPSKRRSRAFLYAHTYVGGATVNMVMRRSVFSPRVRARTRIMNVRVYARAIKSVQWAVACDCDDDHGETKVGKRRMYVYVCARRDGQTCGRTNERMNERTDERGRADVGPILCYRRPHSRKLRRRPTLTAE